MPRATSSRTLTVPITTAIKILDKNPYRLYYTIQNLDTANYIATSPNPQVTAGIFGNHEGEHLAAGQEVSDDTDQAEVWAVANTAAVNVNVREVAETEEFPHNPARAPGRQEKREPGRELASRVW